MKKIIFFDGICNVCNYFINFIFINNSDQSLKVASLQGETAKAELNEHEHTNIDTVIYLRDQKRYYRSSAIIYILRDMGFPFKVAFIFIIIPSFIRDFIYKKFAKYRYKVFGKKDTCRLPTPEEKSRFLP